MNDALRRTTGFLCLLGAASLAAPAASQPVGSSDLVLFGPTTGTDTHLVDANGVTVHTWPSAFRPGLGVYLLDDGSLLRAISVGAIGAPGGVGGGVERVALDGTVLWSFRYNGPGVFSHHDIAPMANGHVLMVAWEDKTTAEAVAAGRDPSLIQAGVFRPDHIIEVQPTGPTSGTIVWKWHAFDHVIQDFDPTKANYGVVGANPQLIDINFPPSATTSGDWNHINGIDHDPVRDLIIVSCYHQNEVWVIDHSTTTAEAAGHTGGVHGKGGDLLYRWGNPQSYRAGKGSPRKLFFQHAPYFIPPGYPGEGNVILFNNRPPGGSAVLELVLPLDPSGRFVFGPGPTYGPAAPVWSYSAPGFSSTLASSAERLPNGNTLVCSSGQGQVFEVSPGGSRVWGTMRQYSIFHAHHVDRSLWSSTATMGLTTPETVGFDLIAGSQHSGETYLVLGSASGTTPGFTASGHLLPLNVDSYLRTAAAFPNIYPFAQTLGTLDALGRATASFSLPGNLTALAGLRLHHAYAVIDPGTAAVTKTSNAVPLDLLRSTGSSGR